MLVLAFAAPAHTWFGRGRSLGSRQLVKIEEDSGAKARFYLGDRGGRPERVHLYFSDIGQNRIMKFRPKDRKDRRFNQRPSGAPNRTEVDAKGGRLIRLRRRRTPGAGGGSGHHREGRGVKTLAGQFRGQEVQNSPNDPHSDGQGPRLLRETRRSLRGDEKAAELDHESVYAWNSRW